MCGRFAQKKALEALKYLANSKLEVTPNFNIAPTCNVPVLVTSRKTGEREAHMMRWGLVPSWEKDTKAAASRINARGETAHEKPAFRSAYKARRCLVPVDGYYEWKKETKQPYFFSPSYGDYFLLAGLWERWKQPDGEMLLSFSLITVGANSTVGAIHDRMPLILSSNQAGEWVKPEGEPDPTLIKPANDDAVQYWPVSEVVNNWRSCGEQLVHPINSL